MQLLTVPQDAEGVGAQAVAAGLDDRHAGGGGDRRIDRIAAGRDHAQPGLRGQRVRGGDDVAGEHRAVLGRIAGIPIEAVGHGGPSGLSGLRRCGRLPRPTPQQARNAPATGTRHCRPVGVRPRGRRREGTRLPLCSRRGAGGAATPTATARGNSIMATRKTTKPGPWKTAAADLIEAAKSLGKAAASKAEQAQAQATTALTQAKKETTARSRKIGREVSATMQDAEARLEQTAERAKQSVRRALDSAEKKAQAAKAQAGRKAKAAAAATHHPFAEASDALVKEARAVQAKAKKQVDAIAASIKRAAAKARSQAADVSTKAAREAGAAKRSAAAATKSAVRKAPARKAARKTTSGQ
ncbi:MAG TPA: hypothetical protein P5305_15370 [Rubrivivax sp.]|nr:hypothetical protein [Rubrivivax sp.]